MVRIAASPSGTAATASDTPITNASAMVCTVISEWVRRMVAMIRTASAMTIAPSARLTRVISACSGVAVSSARWSRSAI
jgi:hypothetical protein